MCILNRLIFTICTLTFWTLPCTAQELHLAENYQPLSSLPAVRLVLKAEYLALPITIQITGTDLASRSERLETSLKLLQDRVHAAPGVVMKQQSLRFPSSWGSSKSLISRGRDDSEQGMITAQLLLSTSIDQNTTLIAASRKIFGAIHELAFPESVALHPGEPLLAIADSQQYRPALLQKINESIASSAKQLGVQHQVEISGLESGLRLTQVGIDEVAISLTYSMSLTQQLRGSR